MFGLYFDTTPGEIDDLAVSLVIKDIKIKDIKNEDIRYVGLTCRLLSSPFGLPFFLRSTTGIGDFGLRGSDPNQEQRKTVKDINRILHDIHSDSDLDDQRSNLSTNSSAAVTPDFNRSQESDVQSGSQDL